MIHHLSKVPYTILLLGTVFQKMGVSNFSLVENLIIVFQTVCVPQDYRFVHHTIVKTQKANKTNLILNEILQVNLFHGENQKMYTYFRNSHIPSSSFLEKMKHQLANYHKQLGELLIYGTFSLSFSISPKIF